MTISPPALRWSDLAHDVAHAHNLDAQLLLAQIDVESAGDPNALRYERDFFTRYILGKTTLGGKYGPFAACSCGLLQILVETAMEIGFTDRPEMLFLPRAGLTWGARYLRKKLDLRGGDYHLALQDYNGRGTAAHVYASAVFAKAGRS